uniref:MADS-box transcription factor 27-like isoform X2 n=1 Tax=Rhizophora mucronata TaxID=61149 RepID=A0A2P2ITN6_RHIMU
MNGTNTLEDSLVPVHLHLGQPQQQNYHTAARATKLRYSLSFHQVFLLCPSIN